MKPYIFPLVKRQFRGLKWFAIGFALLVCWFAMMFNSTLDGVVSSFWRDGVADYYYIDAPGGALRVEQTVMLVMLGMLTVAMAAFQMLDAYKPQNALLMGSLPPTRGAQLAAQLGSGIAIIALSTLLFGLLAHLSYANHREMMVLQARMSAVPDLTLAANTHWVVFVGWLRLMIVLISLYLGITMFCGLFGNAALSLGVLAAMGFFVYMAIGLGSGAMYSIHRMYPNLEGFSGSRVLDAVISMGVSRSNVFAPGSSLPLMPWTDLPWFLSIHALLWAAGLFCIAQTRKHLAIESLGNLFPFKVSRWVVVLIATAFPMVLPLTAITTWDSALQEPVFNPDLPLFFIPALLVFVVGWVFVIWRPQRKLKRRAIPAVALALALLLVPGMARAEKSDVPTIQAQFDPSRLSYDKAAMDRNQALLDAIGEKSEEARKLRDPSYEEYEYGDYPRHDYRQDVYNKYCAVPSFKNYQRLDAYFKDMARSPSLGGYYMNEQELADVLRDAGLGHLADALLNNTADSLLAAQDGYFLTWVHLTAKESEKNPGAATAEYSLSTNSQFQVVGSEAVDAAIRLGDKVCRTKAFSNGDLDTQSYEIPVIAHRYYDYLSTSVHAVFQNGSLNRLMLAGYKDSPPMQDAFDALRRALIAAGQAETGANAAIDAIEQLYAADKLGSGSSGAIRWSLTSAGWRSPERRVMIELG